MGNTAHVASGVKKQADSSSKNLYQLVNLNGGGELMESAKRAAWTKNYHELDRKILREIPRFLYNNGEGKKIPIVDLVLARNKERCKTKIKNGKKKQQKAHELAKIDMNLADAEGGFEHRADRKYRDVCWKIEDRGAVGETCLHMCFLNSSPIHETLAKRLLFHFPKLINDIYLSEEYYGENALHMAIVLEDPAMVKFLLDKGIDVHERCCGNFFTPDDQKNSRTDSLDHEWVEVCEKTNYEGHVYFGEYPLGFAACLGQEECVRLLIAKGADPNLQDCNGNTVMHMLVIMDKKEKELEGQYTSRKEMFNILYSLGARLDIRNRQHLTPLTLAANLARKEMYEHILETIRQIYWIYGNVTCGGYPLPDIDTIAPSGELDKFSVLNLVVYGESSGHLDMMDGLIVNLLNEKWKVFARYRFYRRFVMFFAYFALFVAAFILHPGTDHCPTIKQINGTDGVLKNVTEIDHGYLLKICSEEDKARFCLESLVLMGAITYIFLAMKEIHHQGFSIFMSTLKGAPAKAMFLMACTFIIMMLPGRAAAAYQYEYVMGVLAILFTAPYFLFFCRGFRISGPFVIMIYKMINGDLRRFFIIYLVFIIGFSQAMFLIFRATDVYSDPAEAVMSMFMMSLGEFGDIYDYFDVIELQALAIIIFLCYMIMVTLLLVNMLIAMMGNTYQLVAETQKEWFRQWAKIVLVVEQSVTSRDRQRYQVQYSQPALDSRRAFPIRWHQSEKEKEERRVAREEQRRKQKEKMSQSRWKKMKTTAMLTKTLNLRKLNVNSGFDLT